MKYRQARLSYGNLTPCSVLKIKSENSTVIKEFANVLVCVGVRYRLVMTGECVRCGHGLHKIQMQSERSGCKRNLNLERGVISYKVYL